MRSPAEMGVIQIEITNYCHSDCANCTRLIGHYRPEQRYFMSENTFGRAVESLVGFPEIVGIMGGEPTMHPQFPGLMEYYRSRVRPEKRGLWTSAPDSYFRHKSTIMETFPRWQLINDRSPGAPSSLHQPILVAISDIVDDQKVRESLIDKCWVQNMWSASITPKGAFFCEVAAAMDRLFDGPGGWPIEKNWWKRTPDDSDFKDQVDQWCHRCGAACPLPRRKSSDSVDDLSLSNFAALAGKSPKVRRGAINKFLKRNWNPELYDWHPSVEWYLENGPQDRVAPHTAERLKK